MPYKIVHLQITGSYPRFPKVFAGQKVSFKLSPTFYILYHFGGNDFGLKLSITSILNPQLGFEPISVRPRGFLFSRHGLRI